MAKRVLDVGQCNLDHGSICRLIEQNFPATVERTHEMQDTLQALRARPCDLILINRKLDLDYSDGMEILRAIKADPDLSAIPIMLVTNYPEFQQAAIAEGAVPGFGKDDLRSPETLEKLKPYLAEV